MVLTSVVTLTHNKMAYTKRCVGSLLETTYCPWELIVVDNGSTDGTRTWLTEFKEEANSKGVEVSLIFNAGNIGCSTARNQGIDKARGERIVFIDNDVALRSRGWLERLGACLESDKRIGSVGPKLIYPFPPYVIQFAGGAVSPTGRVKFMGRGEARDDPQLNLQQEVQCFISACMMVKRSVVDKVGYFDEIFNPVEYEDIDYSYRLRSEGYKIIYLPTVEMYHFESVTTGRTPALHNTYLIIKNGMTFKKRWRSMFEKEGGPPDAETKWREIERWDLSRIGKLEVVE